MPLHVLRQVFVGMNQRSGDAVATGHSESGPCSLQLGAYSVWSHGPGVLADPLANVADPLPNRPGRLGIRADPLGLLADPPETVADPPFSEADPPWTLADPP